MGYDRDDNFPIDFEPNGFPFGSENRKENCHYDHIPSNLKENTLIVFQADVIYSSPGKTSPLLLVGRKIHCPKARAAARTTVAQFYGSN